MSITLYKNKNRVKLTAFSCHGCTQTYTCNSNNGDIRSNIYRAFFINYCHKWMVEWNIHSLDEIPLLVKVQALSPNSV